MGGENSEVLDTTKTILFESATFNGVSVRKTAIANGLRTEASSRYEKAVDADRADQALALSMKYFRKLSFSNITFIN